MRAIDADELIKDLNKKYGWENTKGKELKIKDKAVIGMNMKLYGRQIEKFQCKKCLMKEFGWTKEDWNNKVEEFENQGCKLF